MKTNDITIYAVAFSPFVVKVRCFLNLKGLDYNVTYINPSKMQAELAFSGQSLVPVVTVGDEFLVDSTPIGIRLDALFPTSTQLLPPQGEVRDKLLQTDAWVTDALMPTSFRTSQALPIRTHLKNSWLSARAVNATAPEGLPWWLWLSWPIVIKKAGGNIRKLKNSVDQSLSVSEMHQQACRGFIEQLEGGPFMAAQETPSLPDCSAYAHFMLPYICGLQGYGDFLQYEEIKAWVQRMTPLVYTPRPLADPALVINDPRSI